MKLAGNKSDRNRLKKIGDRQDPCGRPKAYFEISARTSAAETAPNRERTQLAIHATFVIANRGLSAYLRKELSAVPMWVKSLAISRRCVFAWRAPKARVENFKKSHRISMTPLSPSPFHVFCSGIKRALTIRAKTLNPCKVLHSSTLLLKRGQRNRERVLPLGMKEHLGCASVCR